MSFFNLSTGQAVVATTEFKMQDDMEPIPDKTQVKAIIDEAKWGEHEGNRFIELRWAVIDGAYKGRKVFQKVRVCEHDAKKRDKALQMLAAIDANAGGKLVQINAEPTDQDLTINLCNKPMALLLRVWELEDKSSKGNWVAAVSPLNKAASAPQPTTQPAVAEDDDIGF